MAARRSAGHTQKTFLSLYAVSLLDALFYLNLHNNLRRQFSFFSCLVSDIF